MYAPGMLKHRVTFVRPGVTVDTDFGRQTQAGDELTRWAAVDWVRGTRALREGALDAYDTIMVRCNWSEFITRDCKIKIGDKSFFIESFHADMQACTIQITAAEETK